MRHRIIEIHQEIFNHNEHEVSKRWTFEEAVSGACGRQHEQLLWEQGWQLGVLGNSLNLHCWGGWTETQSWNSFTFCCFSCEEAPADVKMSEQCLERGKVL